MCLAMVLKTERLRLQPLETTLSTLWMVFPTLQHQALMSWVLVTMMFMSEMVLVKRLHQWKLMNQHLFLHLTSIRMIPFVVQIHFSYQQLRLLMPSIFGRDQMVLHRTAQIHLFLICQMTIPEIIRYTFKLTVVIVIPLLPQLRSMRPTT